MSRRNSKKSAITTNKGRVVYNRKPHLFQLHDLVRIVPYIDLERETWDSISKAFAELWRLENEVILEMFRQSSRPHTLFQALLQRVWDLVGNISHLYSTFEFDVWEALVEWVIVRLNLVKPKSK